MLKDVSKIPVPSAVAIVAGARCGVGAVIGSRIARDGIAVAVNYAPDDWSDRHPNSDGWEILKRQCAVIAEFIETEL